LKEKKVLFPLPDKFSKFGLMVLLPLKFKIGVELPLPLRLNKEPELMELLGLRVGLLEDGLGNQFALRLGKMKISGLKLKFWSRVISFPNWNSNSLSEKVNTSGSTDDFGTIICRSCCSFTALLMERTKSFVFPIAGST